MQRSVRIGAVALTLVAVALTFAIPAHAGGSGTAAADAQPYVVGQRTSPTLSDDQREDLQMVAESLGISLEEAIGRFGGQDDFALAIERLRVIAPETFSAAAIESGDGYQAWVSFVGKPSTEAETLLAQLPIAVQVRTGADFSEKALVETQERIFYTLVDAVGADRISSSLGQDGTISVTYDMSDAALHEAVQAVLSDARRATGVKAPIVVENGVLELMENAEVGGKGLTGCTAAFTVHSSVAAGVSTAGHCNNVSPTYSVVSGWAVTANFQAEHEGANGDVQWHKLMWQGQNVSIRNTFVYTPAGGTRQVTAVADPVSGQSICRFGQVTGTNCDTVAAINQCHGMYCKLVRLNGSTANLGDSGGPLYSGNNANAIHHGNLTNVITGQKWDLSTPASSLAYIGVTVNITPGVWIP